MRIFKSKQCPTREKFLELVAAYEQYRAARRRGETVSSTAWPAQVLEYARLSRTASQQNEEPPALEWFDITEEEWQTQEQENQEKERKKKAEKEAEERRNRDLSKAREDGEFRDEFIEREMDSRGFTTRKLVLALIQEREDGKSMKDFWKRRKEALKEIGEEIKKAGK